jgi:putative FmdB family regulatory protein
MPTYEYVCEKCDKSFDAFQSMKDDAYTVCPKDKCLKKSWGKGRVKRAIGTGAGLLFKGDGFYITDYRSEGYKKSASNDKPKTESKETKKSDSGGSATKSESKPAKTKSS